MARAPMTNEIITNYKKMIITKSKEYIDKHGYEAATIKSIAEITYMNKAYLYRFFNNLNEIKLYCSVTELKSYINELADKKILNNDENALEKYYDSWSIFCKHAFSHRENFKLLYFSEHTKNLRVIIHDYFNLFQENNEIFSKEMLDAIASPDINHRTDYFLYKAFRDKSNEKDLKLISKLSECYFRDLLYKTKNEDSETVNAQIKEMDNMLRFLNKALD